METRTFCMRIFFETKSKKIIVICNGSGKRRRRRRRRSELKLWNLSRSTADGLKVDLFQNAFS